MNKNDVIKFEQFQRRSHYNQQKNGLSKESQCFQSLSTDCGHCRDHSHNCDHDKSQFYRKGNHQNPATDPKLNVI